MIGLNQITPLLFIAFAYFLYYLLNSGSDSLSTFVPSNAFEVPTNLKQKDWQVLNEKFGQLMQAVNTTTFNVSYQLDSIIDAFLTIINSVGAGKFTILSVGESQQFTLKNVLIQDIESLAVVRFKRVDFIVESMNPFKIQKVIITPDQQYTSSQNVVPTDPQKPNFFRIQNPLHLFSPYRTSDNEMLITKDDADRFQKEIVDKAVTLKTISAENTTELVKPTPSELSPQIIGAGPLRSI